MNTMTERIFAFTDESGAFGWDLDNETVSTHFLITAILVKESDLYGLRNSVESIRQKYFQTGEMKSSHIGRNHQRRIKVLNDLLELPFSILTVVIDKSQLTDSRGLQHRKPFYKFTNNIVHKELQYLFSKLTIVADEIGRSDYMKSFCEYVKARVPAPNLFGESDFSFANSQNDVLIQLADLVCGSLSYDYDFHKKDNRAPSYHKILERKITRIEFYPKNYTDYSVDTSALAKGYDSQIAAICLKKAAEFLELHQNEENEDIKAQVIVLKYLLFRFMNNDTRKYIPTKELKNQLQYTANADISTQTFRTKIIGSLRDNGVIISGSSVKKGYKIPANEGELLDFINHGTSIIIPMLERMKKCRDTIRLGTLNQIDLFSRTEYASLKRYFDD